MPFDSVQFSKYANNWNFKTKKRSPRYCQSNGLADKGVSIAKNMIRKCYKSNSNHLEVAL